ncbi:MAG: ammonium transporter [Sphingomonadales bacterium]|nr:ammonium transporter [Sphingomonadales bacterium]
MFSFKTNKTGPKPLKVIAGTLLAFAASTTPTFAAVESETAFVFNTLLFLIGGFLVMWMAAGFAMLEAGLVRTKNVADICLKNVALYALAGVTFFLVGYNLMYAGVDGGYVGTLNLWGSDDTAALLKEGADFSAGYGSASDWFFQMAFAATAASIVSGTIAERTKLFPFLIFTAVLTGVIYPIIGAWKWGEGWLHVLGFNDFAGSTIVHSTGGWAALVAALIIGARKGKYDKAGNVRPIPGSNLPLATLGTFILWFGWFGFNGASQLALGSAADAVAIGQIFANTNMAAAGGVLTALVLSHVIYKKVDLTMTLNGALAGLVSITAEPLTPTLGEAVLIGSAGAMIVMFAVPLLDRLRIDDVVGAIPVHLFAGIWGTLAVPLTNSGATLSAQITGIAASGLFVVVASGIALFAIDKTLGLRLHEEDEIMGSDRSELGLEAYPEFGHGTQKLGL